jgi:hypothetical protein
MKVLPIKVNADYESVLFGGPSLAKINEALDFLPLFLEDAPLLTHKKYSPSYLEMIQETRGSKPLLLTSGHASNWWGELKDIELERSLNSKLTSAQLSLAKGWIQESFILETAAEVQKLPLTPRPMLAKNANEMSGRGFLFLPHGVTEESKTDLAALVLKGPLILEPFLQRKFDFSHYIFPDGKAICYETLVDDRFQYKGTLFTDWENPSIESLTFFSRVPADLWNDFRLRLDVIRNFYAQKVSFADLAFGFSIDSIVHEEKNQMRIHPLCEVNFRRTMGRVAYDLSKRYAGPLPWTCFLILPACKDSISRTESLRRTKRFIHLSPEGARFTMVFLMAANKHEAKKMLSELQKLLALGELPVKIE